MGELANNLHLLKLGLCVEAKHVVAGFLVGHQPLNWHDCVPPRHVPLVENPIFDLADARRNQQLLALNRLERQEAIQATVLVSESTMPTKCLETGRAKASLGE